MLDLCLWLKVAPARLADKTVQLLLSHNIVHFHTEVDLGKEMDNYEY